MISSTCSSSRWWSQISQNDGLALLDQHVQPNAAWEQMAQTGTADWQRARLLTGIPAGRHLSLLEIGCGAGRMTGVLATEYGHVMALDVSKFYLRCARRRCRANNVTFRAIEGDTLQPVANRLYDAAFSYEVFHYLAPRLLDSYIREIYSLLRPGGQFVFELNTEPLGWATLGSLQFRRILHACGKRAWRGWPTSPHFIRKVHSVAAVVSTLERVGFSVSQVIHPRRRETWFVATKPQSGR